ncbi:alpha/beta fold hydrolase [Variovorax boronicumulans]|uniref:alpha/beta fold hydrolase n=1 Tax=Variovorax boronicumulans TaxID=436515 RepID=UPI001C594100
MQSTSQTIPLPSAASQIAVHRHGDPRAPAVYMAHSILSSSAMWATQAALLASRGWQVLCTDTRGHGSSVAGQPPATMQQLVDDTVAVLDALGLEKVHYVGLSLGGMSGFGLALAHADRLESLCLCAARADMPPEAGAPWDERIATAEREGCGALARPTLERWFGRAFLDAHPDTAQRLLQVAASTSVTGFVGCARAIQGLDYLARVQEIALPTTLIVGANDGVLPQAMADIHRRIAGSVLEVIAQAGHLPNIDQAAAFDAALLRHLGTAERR